MLWLPTADWCMIPAWLFAPSAGRPVVYSKYWQPPNGPTAAATAAAADPGEVQWKRREERKFWPGMFMIHCCIDWVFLVLQFTQSMQFWSASSIWHAHKVMPQSRGLPFITSKVEVRFCLLIAVWRERGSKGDAENWPRAREGRATIWRCFLSSFLPMPARNPSGQRSGLTLLWRSWEVAKYLFTNESREPLTPSLSYWF